MTELPPFLNSLFLSMGAQEDFKNFPLFNQM